ncbi:alpha-glucosidase C-terminal domain-containing protein [Mitsuokella jalaludinii]|uniref:alpha-glucosidase C-terminal domain-containing protein n=1 Tax=Mitsuokella jalaludinii TaxID=187979 RepID=UPI003F89BDE6
MALRKEHRIIAEGSIRFLERENDEILAYERELEGEHLLVLCNFRASDIAMPELHAAGEKFIGNYPGMAACLRPYEVVALRWVE